MSNWQRELADMSAHDTRTINGRNVTKDRHGNWCVDGVWCTSLPDALREVKGERDTLS